ncbi:hypothetical protein HMPREF1574_01342 [Gardnerella pickettii JCP7659]|nr:hypothetical protein HMPREF1574_01342 [Gardnerella pickettii JCP7659]EPI58680.1 hypothetical protein HMPREF1579_01140 [Gardnerella vaginalis JCP8066]
MCCNSCHKISLFLIAQFNARLLLLYMIIACVAQVTFCLDIALILC